MVRPVVKITIRAVMLAALLSTTGCVYRQPQPEAATGNADMTVMPATVI